VLTDRQMEMKQYLPPPVAEVYVLARIWACSCNCHLLCSS